MRTTLSRLRRLRRVGGRELAWRGREAFEIGVTRLAACLVPPRWDRRRLLRRLAPLPALAEAARHLEAENFQTAHTALAAYYHQRAPRFPIAPSMRTRVAELVRRHHPEAAAHATQRADRVLAGRYDILGYRDLPFDGAQWHTDPVHGRTAPRCFWSKVPYLHASCGDHKVIWELNRHQHWLALGRAAWLTGNERYRDEILRQLSTWLDANPPLIGINWASMLELGLRALSWIWALNFCADPDRRDATPWLVDMLLGIDRQLAHIERHLSYYFSPNTHLLGEALALYVVGRTLPELRASLRRERLGRRILIAEIGRQVLADGGHCERSAHYHRYALDFYLLALVVARLTGDEAAPLFRDTCARLASAARLLADETGRLPQLGDDDGGSLLPLTARDVDDVRDSLAVAAVLTGRPDLAVGRLPLPEEVWWLLSHEMFSAAIEQTADARRASVSPRDDAAGHHADTRASAALPHTGYYISRNGAGDHIVIDAGPHGFLNGGHAHADALSLTMSRRGRRLLIDPGTGCYTADLVLRDRFRSTALHNTLVLDGRSQSLPSGPFHWRQTAEASMTCWRTAGVFDYFAGVHDGYLPLLHARHVFVLHEDLVVVADCVFAGADGGEEERRGETHEASVHWHLEPAWSIRLLPGGLRLSGERDSVDLFTTGSRLEVIEADHASGLGWRSPAYGRVEPGCTVRIVHAGALPLWVVTVFGLDAGNGIARVELEPVEAVDGMLGPAVSIRVARARTLDQLVVAEPRDTAAPAVYRAGGLEADARMVYVRFAGRAPHGWLFADGRVLRSTTHFTPRVSFASPVAVFTEGWPASAAMRRAVSRPPEAPPDHDRTRPAARPPNGRLLSLAREPGEPPPAGASRGGLRLVEPKTRGNSGA